MENKNYAEIEKMLMCILGIENSLKFADKEMSDMNIEQSKKDEITYILGSYLSTLFDVRNLLWVIAKGFDIIIIDELIEGSSNEKSIQENISEIGSILGEYNDKLKKYTDALILEEDGGKLTDPNLSLFLSLVMSTTTDVLNYTKEIRESLNTLTERVG
jgi:hypothetical protein